MIELINTIPQTVAANNSVVFNTQTTRSCNAVERWRGGSGLVTLTGKGRYLVTFSGNIAIPTGGTVGEISLGITQNGEILNGSVMRVTPAAVNEYFNVSKSVYVDVPCNCCETISIRNDSGTDILVDNPNLIVVRVCG